MREVSQIGEDSIIVTGAICKGIKRSSVYNLCMICLTLIARDDQMRKAAVRARCKIRRPSGSLPSGQVIEF